MPRSEKYFVGPKLLGDIRETITRVAGFSDETSGPHINSVHQELQRPGGRLKRGTFTHASWAIGQTMQVTIQGETNTVSVTNYCTPFSGSTAATQTRNVIYGNVMGTVTAVEIQQPVTSLTVITGATLTTAGLQFTQAIVTVQATATASIITIGTTEC